MILNMYDTKDESFLQDLEKCDGIKLIRRYLPHIDANLQGYVVNTLDEWYQIRDKFPEVVTLRTDSKIIDKELLNVHGATRKKEDIDSYIIDVSTRLKEPYFICLELEPGSNERIYTQGGFLLEFKRFEDIKIGYVGPGFDCGELTKGVGEHEVWQIPWDRECLSREDAIDKFRLKKVSDKIYQETALKRMAFLISEYKDRKQEIMDVFPKKYNGIDPNLFRKLQQQVLLPMWRQQRKLEKDGLSHYGIEINVVGDNILVPFEIEKPEAFRVKELNNDYYSDRILNKQKSKSFSENQKKLQEIMKYGKAKGIVLIRKYLPKLNEFNGIKIIKSIEEWEQIKDSLPDRVTTRTDTVIGDTRQVRIDGASGKIEEIPSVITQIKSQNPDGVLLLLDTKSQTIPRYENDGGFNIGFNMNESVVIELVGKGFDGREITREKAVHERYVIPWNDVLFMRNKTDLMKSRDVSKYIISDEQYKQTRQERINFLSDKEDKQEVESLIPTTYTESNDELIKNILDQIVFELYSRKNDLARDGLRNFNVQGNIVDGRLIPWEIFRPERLISKSKKEERDGR